MTTEATVAKAVDPKAAERKAERAKVRAAELAALPPTYFAVGDIIHCGARFAKVVGEVANGDNEFWKCEAEGTKKVFHFVKHGCQEWTYVDPAKIEDVRKYVTAEAAAQAVVFAGRKDVQEAAAKAAREAKSAAAKAAAEKAAAEAAAAEAKINALVEERLAAILAQRGIK